MSDPFKDLRTTAEMDQMQTGVSNLGKTMGSYYRALQAEGMEPFYAIRVVIHYQHMMMAKSMWPDEPPPSLGSDE